MATDEPNNNSITQQPEGISWIAPLSFASGRESISSISQTNSIATWSNCRPCQSFPPPKQSKSIDGGGSTWRLVSTFCYFRVNHAHEQPAISIPAIAAAIAAFELLVKAIDSVFFR